MTQGLHQFNLRFLKFSVLFFIFIPHVNAASRNQFSRENKIAQVDDLSRESLIAELTGKDVRRLDEKGLFSQILMAYQTDNGKQLKYYFEELIKKYPKSSLADNALYIIGLYNLNHKNFGNSIQYFNRIKKDYKHSEKVVSALFAKAMVYKMTGLPELSRGVLNEVLKDFPGSPESLRAGMELRLIK